MHCWQGTKEEFPDERLNTAAKTPFKACQLSTTSVSPQDYIHTLNPLTLVFLISDARRHKLDVYFWGVSGLKPCLAGTPLGLAVMLIVGASLLPADKSGVSTSTVGAAGRSCRASASACELWISVMIEVVGQFGDSLTTDWVSLCKDSNNHILHTASSSWSKKMTSQMSYLS